MINFMFAVLGSTLFWVGFFVVGFFVGTLVLKKVAKSIYDFIIGKEEYNPFGPYCVDYVPIVAILLLCYLFWPVILLVLSIGFIVKHIFWKSFCKAVKSVDSIIPTVKFEKSEDKGGEKTDA